VRGGEVLIKEVWPGHLYTYLANSKTKTRLGPWHKKYTNLAQLPPLSSILAPFPPIHPSSLPSNLF